MAYEFFFQYLYPLFQDSQFSFLRLFQYITFRSAYAALMALCLSLLALPWLIQFFHNKKLSQPIRKEGPNHHFNKSGTPTMGGILVLSITILSVLFWQDSTLIIYPLSSSPSSSSVHSDSPMIIKNLPLNILKVYPVKLKSSGNPSLLSPSSLLLSNSTPTHSSIP